MRMSLASARRQPCSVGSCIDGDEEAPVRAERHVEMRALPGEAFPAWPARSETRASRRRSARSRGAAPSARTRARRRSTAGRAISPRPWRCARRPACRPTTRPRRPARARRDRSSDAWRRWRASRSRPSHSVATTLPSSPPVTMRVAVRRGRQNAAGMHRDALLAAVWRHEQQRLLAEHERGATLRKCTATTGAPAATGFMRSAMDGMLFGVSDTGSVRRDGALETLADLLLGQIAPDEHHAARGASRPRAIRAGDRRRASCARPGTRSAADRPCSDTMPLQRRMFGPSACVRFWMKGKNLSGSSGLSVESEIDCISSS